MFPFDGCHNVEENLPRIFRISRWVNGKVDWSNSACFAEVTKVARYTFLSLEDLSEETSVSALDFTIQYAD